MGGTWVDKTRNEQIAVNFIYTKLLSFICHWMLIVYYDQFKVESSDMEVESTNFICVKMSISKVRFWLFIVQRCGALSQNTIMNSVRL